jgi:HlyD family secretion protein
MTTDQVTVRQEPAVAQKHENIRKKPAARRTNWGLLVFLLLAAAGGAAGYFYVTSQRGRGQESGGGGEGSTGQHLVTKVQVVTPNPGGLARVTSQPGTIRAKEFAPLYAKVSGYVKTLNVDRGSKVKEGELLMELYDPELEVAVTEAKAGLAHARAAEVQAKAHIRTAEAGLKAAMAKQNAAQATREEAESQYSYRKKQYARMEQLAAQDVIDRRLADEELEHYHSSEAAVHAAEAGILTALAEKIEAEALVDQAKADWEAAVAQIQVSDAVLEKAKVFFQYTRITSPYDGFVTERGEGVHRGTFIRAATENGGSPVLTVAMTKKMRTIVLIPDRDVPYVNEGDPATVVLDAVGARVFEGKVSRVSESEDLKDRTMRVEVDLPNEDGVLRDGMFGRVIIVLEKETPFLTILSSCLIERNGKGEGAVLVVKDGKVHRAAVRVGRDDGLKVEIVSGLSATDQVINQPDASIAEGTTVQIESPDAPSAEPAEHATAEHA